MLIDRFPEILQLSREEMIELVEELQDILESNARELELSPEQGEELGRRRQAFLDNPGNDLFKQVNSQRKKK